MKILKIKNEYLTGYYLYEKFQEYREESGLYFITDGEEEEKIELYYNLILFLKK